MPDRISIAACAVAVLALLVALVAPSPRAARRGGVSAAEKIALLVEVEKKALEEDRRLLYERADLKGLLERVEGKSLPADGRDLERAVSEDVRSELAHRWGQFQDRLRTIKLYEKKPEAGSGGAMPDATGATEKAPAGP